MQQQFDDFYVGVLKDFKLMERTHASLSQAMHTGQKEHISGEKSRLKVDCSTWHWSQKSWRYWEVRGLHGTSCFHVCFNERVSHKSQWYCYAPDDTKKETVIAMRQLNEDAVKYRLLMSCERDTGQVEPKLKCSSYRQSRKPLQNSPSSVGQKHFCSIKLLDLPD